MREFPGMEFRILGQLQVVNAGRPVALGGARQERLLAALILAAGRPVSVARLGEIIYDDPPVGLRKQVQNRIAELRKALDARSSHNDPVVRQSCGYLLRAARAQDCLELATAVGDGSALVAELRALVAQYPLRQRLVALLMTALYLAGDQAAALAAYRTLTGHLADREGLDPTPELQEHYQSILRGDLPRPVPATAVMHAPVPAQLPMDVRGFTGRTAQLKALDALAAEARDEATAVVISAVGYHRGGKAEAGIVTLFLHRFCPHLSWLRAPVACSGTPAVGRAARRHGGQPRRERRRRWSGHGGPGAGAPADFETIISLGEGGVGSQGHGG